MTKTNDDGDGDLQRHQQQKRRKNIIVDSDEEDWCNIKQITTTTITTTTTTTTTITTTTTSLDDVGDYFSDGHVSGDINCNRTHSNNTDNSISSISHCDKISIILINHVCIVIHSNNIIKIRQQIFHVTLLKF